MEYEFVGYFYIDPEYPDATTPDFGTVELTDADRAAGWKARTVYVLKDEKPA